jgi:CBS domain containing-hemolysin-like protein
MPQEQLDQLVARYSRLGRKYVKEGIIDSRAAIQLNIIVKSSTLIASAYVALLSARNFRPESDLGFLLIYGAELAVVWLLYVYFMEYLPGRKALKPIEAGEIKFIFLFSCFYLILMPFLKLYNRISIFRPAKISEEHKEEIIERAIETLVVQAGVNEPIVEEREKEMIGQILQLDETEAREVMVPRINIVGLPKNASLEDIRKLTAEHGYSRYPVFEDNLDNIVGILYVKDLFTKIPLPIDETAFDIKKYIRDAYFIPESKKINVLLSEFKTNKIHIAIVIDEYGGTAGLITMENILEEIVGDIQDEHDHEKSETVKMADDTILVDAGISVDEMARELGLEYETEEFETVGGLIYDLVGSVPAVGAKLKWKDILLEVMAVEGQRIISVKAKVSPERKTT